MSAAQSCFFRLSLSAFLCLSLLQACTNEPDKQRFIRTYAQILVMREYYPDTARGNPKIREVLKANGYTDEEFREEFSRYSRTTDELRSLMDSAQTEARRQIEAGKKK